MAVDRDNLRRYDRQIVFAPLGLTGQKALMAGRALIVGVGGLGSWMAEILSRAGVGFLRLADDDHVSPNNLHRQGLYDDADARDEAPKVLAAAARLRRINPAVAVEAREVRLTAGNIRGLAGDVDVILDGTDSFAPRFVINDFAVQAAKSWIFSGVVGAEAQTMTIVPGATPCLRCVFESPPPPCADPSCRLSGVLGPAVAAVASIAAMEAIKILAGSPKAVSPYLLKMDLWTNAMQRIDVARAAAGVDCPCCKHRLFEFLEA